MARVHRIDSGTLAKPVKRPDGTIIVEARLARSGVQTYRNADGSERREYRPDSEVFNPASMASFRLVPVTNGHPPKMLDASNATQYAVGSVGENIRRDGKWMIAPIVVYDANTIREMYAGKNQVSNGYECDLVMRAGVSPDGERYDCEQTNIAGNHLAIEHNARAGKDAAARMDAAWSIDDREQRNDGAYMDLAQALAALNEANQKLGKHKERADALETENKDLKARADKAEAERDASKERADKAERERTDAANGQAAIVGERVALIAAASKILGVDITKPFAQQVARIDGADRNIAALDERGLKLAVIKHVTNADCANDASGKPRSMDYINARYDAAAETAVASADTFRGANNALEQHRLDSGKTTQARKDAAAEYAKMVDENRNAWKRVAHGDQK